MLLRLMSAKADGESRIERNDDSKFREHGDALLGLMDKGCIRQQGQRPKQSPRELPQDWMSLLDDEILLSAVTIPGTHDSVAYTSSWPYVRTQRMSILEQLNSGIRYFDLRCGIRDDIVQMVHGSIYLGLRLDNVLDVMYDWLALYPSEGLIVQIKKDHNSRRSTVHFAEAISKVLVKDAHVWRTADITPSIRELRGRIQLLRRYGRPCLAPYGIDVSTWQDNTSEPFTIHTRHGIQVTIQDHYVFKQHLALPSLVARKMSRVSELLYYASNDVNPSHWFINYTSTYEFNWLHRIQPHEVAVGGRSGFQWIEGINVRIRAILKEAYGQKIRFGVVAMDFPEQGADDLIAALITSNFETDIKDVWKHWTTWMCLFALAVCFIVSFWVHYQPR